MNLLIIWISLIIIIGFSKYNNFELIFTSLIMLYITYAYNIKIPTLLSLNYIILIGILPSSIIFYILYKCNEFL